MKLCREQGYSIQAAQWATHRNQEHRMKHWVTILSIANNRRDTTTDKAAKEIEHKKKQVAQLQKARSMSPRGAKGSGKSSRGQLAPQDSTAQPSNIGKGGRGKGDKDDKSCGGKVKSQHTGPFAELFYKVGFKVLHKHNETKPGFCFPFQSVSCAKLNCRQHHNCAGCDKVGGDKVGVSYDDCLCLAHL